MLFIDEIDAVLNLPFSTDEFFAAIRACYNDRGREPALRRLTFCLLGVATPSDLIQDARTTPFNVGHRIDLADLTDAEAAPLAAGLVTGEQTRRMMLQRILYWAGGHPYLTQRLCQAVAAGSRDGGYARDAGTRMRDGKGRPVPHPSSPIPHPSLVDRHCESLFLSASARERDDNLLFVREWLLRSETGYLPAGEVLAGLLDLYQRVWRGRRVRLEKTNHFAGILLLSGIVRVVQARRRRAPFNSSRTLFPYLRVRNRIYERVFDREWVTQHMPDAELLRQRRAYIAGMVRAASAAGVVLLVVTGLAVAALHQAQRAASSAREAKHSTRVANLNRARAQAEANRANSEAQHARQAEHREREQRTRAEAAGHNAVRQEQIAVGEAAAADQARQSAIREERKATERLRASYLDQARAGRWSGRPGRRFDGLDALARAAAIQPSTELRNEAIACLSLIDLRTKWQRQFDYDAYSLDFSPDLKCLALGDTQGSVRVYRVADGRLLKQFPGPRGQVGPVRFSPDGRFLAGAYHRGGRAHLVVWELERDRTVLRLPEGLHREAVDFSPDSRRLAVGGDDGVIHLYALPSGTETGRLPPGPPPLHLQFDPDGRRLAVSSLDVASVQIRDVATGAVTTTLVSPAPIRGVAWHPYRNLVAGAGDDWHVYLWELDTLNGRLPG